jgi:hypothetical protein
MKRQRHFFKSPMSVKKLFGMLIGFSLAIRTILFFVLPDGPSRLGPDEGTYGALAAWTDKGFPAVDFPLYGEGLYLSSRTFIWPAAALHQVGLSQLNSVRLVAVIYSLLTSFLVYFLSQKIVATFPIAADFVQAHKKLIIGSAMTFVFLPSHFVWASIGLRESAVEFWVLLAFSSVFWMFHISKRATIQGLFVLAISIVFTFSARPQVGWVLGISLLLSLGFHLKSRISLILIPIVVLSIFLGFLGTINSNSWRGTPSTNGTTGTPSTNGNIGTKLFGSLKTTAEITAYRHQVNQLDAESVIVTQSCPREGMSLINRPPSSFDVYFCIAWRAPYMASTFLFRPILGLDVTSTASLVAAIENVLWLGAFLAALMIFIRKRRVAFLKELVPSLIFFVLYTIGAGSYEGNMGTAFRHKSLILWVVILLVISATVVEKPINTQKKFRKVRFNEV